MQLFTPVQLISFWFHEIFMGRQQVPSRESYVPGDVARYRGGIQIIHCSKLAPCVSNVPCCSKNSVTVFELKLSACASLKSRASNLPSSLLTCGSKRLAATTDCADRKMHSCHEIRDGLLNVTSTQPLLSSWSVMMDANVKLAEKASFYLQKTQRQR